MRIAALYDIHANLPAALEAVLTELDADLVIVEGDAAAGQMPAEVLDVLRAPHIGAGKARHMGSVNWQTLSKLEKKEWLELHIAEAMDAIERSG